MVGDVACIGEIRNVYKILVAENLKGRHHLGYLYLDREILVPSGRVQWQTFIKTVIIL